MNFLLLFITLLAIIGNLLMLALYYVASKQVEGKDKNILWMLTANNVLSIIAILSLALFM